MLTTHASTRVPHLPLVYMYRYGSSTEGVCKCTRTNGEKCDIEMGPVLAIISALSLCGMFCCCMGIFNNEDEDANPILAFFVRPLWGVTGTLTRSAVACPIFCL